jgi:hypothetical protein
MRARVLSSVLALGAVLGAAALPGAARAESNEPAVAGEAREISVGTALVAVADISLQKASLSKGARIQVTKVATQKGRVTTVDVELADGHVLRRVAIDTILKAFVVATAE